MNESRPTSQAAPANRAVVLLSGGLDSATTLALASEAGFACHALSFRYGQRHDVELQCARELAVRLDSVEHIEIEIDMRKFGGSALTDDIEVPKGRALEEMRAEIPTTYVPARNTVFLSFALAWAEVLQAFDIFIGVNALDYSGYPDCRPEYIEAFQRMANLATRSGIEGRQRLQIQTPLIDLTKAEIIRRGTVLGVDYARTSSCYDPTPDGCPCRECDSCQLRARGFAEAGLTDPLYERFGLSK